MMAVFISHGERTMAKTKAVTGQVKATGGRKPIREPKADSPIRHVQIKIPVKSYEDAKRVAEANGLPLAAYVRQALLRQIRADVGDL
jgi:hypothetical protein